MVRRLIVLFGLSLVQLAHAQVQVVDLQTRPGITMRVAYFQADAPRASAVLIQGGTGKVGIFPNGSMRNEGFLAGNGSLFAKNGISSLVIDLPSDRSHLDEFRATPEHAEDIAAAIRFMREKGSAPVWLIGTSNGSLSAAAAAERLGSRGPNGIVLTAATTRKITSGAHPVTEARLSSINLPTLFVHHKEDSCIACPYEAIPELLKQMTMARKVELISIEGGERRGNPCYSNTHQFLGIEAGVIEKITDWIKAN